VSDEVKRYKIKTKGGSVFINGIDFTERAQTVKASDITSQVLDHPRLIVEEVASARIARTGGRSAAVAGDEGGE
jgi:hypothetical protein